MFSKLLLLTTFTVAVRAEHWIFGGSRPIVTTRLDSIVSPGQVSSHVHSIVGASRFKSIYDPNDLVQSNCTTIPVQPDKSNYWAPQLYHQDQQTGQFTPIPTSFNIYYLMRPGPKNESIKAFPPGLRMLAGDTLRRSFNASDFAQQAVTFVCLDFESHGDDPDWIERPNFFNHTCPAGMRAQVFFPSCWDGQNLDSPDHKSHMAYPIQNFNTGDCPESHPVHLVSLFYEMIVSVDRFDYSGPGSWVLANGDTTGYGHHGDFQNGWDVNLLQDAIDNCPEANGNVMDCPPLAAAFDQASSDACVLETQVVDEETGFGSPIFQLPGCNPLWDGTGPRPTCPSSAAPELVSVQTPLPTNWTEVGCIAEGDNGRALTAASTTSPNMTRAMCSAFCSSKGFALAGVEFSDECYCDNQLRNGASNDTVTWNECKNLCAGNKYEICGGPLRLTLMVDTNPAPAKTGLPAPAGWSALGCVSDSSARALTGFSFANDSMTIPSCVSACATHGFSIAGIEFGRECYCGNSFENDVGVSIDSSKCDVVCDGDTLSTCGGSWALSAFQNNSTSVPPATSTSASSTGPTTTRSSSSAAASSTLTSFSAFSSSAPPSSIIASSSLQTSEASSSIPITSSDAASSALSTISAATSSPQASASTTVTGDGSPSARTSIATPPTSTDVALISGAVSSVGSQETGTTNESRRRAFRPRGLSRS